MNSGEDYLEHLLKSMTEPKQAEPSSELPVIDAASSSEEDAMLGELQKMTEEPAINEPISEEAVIAEPVIEEPIIEEPFIEEPIIEEPVTEEPIIEEPFIEEPIVEEPFTEEPIIEEPFTEEPIIEEPIIEEPVIDESVIEEPIIEEPIIEEPVIDEPVIEEPIIEEPIVDNVAEDAAPESTVLQDEDISNLLSSLGELEETPEPEGQSVEGQEMAISPEELEKMADLLDIKELSSNQLSDDELGSAELLTAGDTDVTELLDQISDDSELNEINELLKKNDNNETVDDDDVLALLEKAAAGDGTENGDDIFAIEEPLDEESDEEEQSPKDKKEKKRREKKNKKEKKERKTKENDPDKKPGFFARLLNSLTEEEMTEESAEEIRDLFGETTTAESLENADAENQELLSELEEEDNGKKGKKGKKAKKEKKEKKEKKPKEKKPKRVKLPKEERPAGKKLPKKQVTVIAVLCASIGLLMIAIALFYPYYNDMRKAEANYQNQNYEMAYECLIGHHLNADEQLLLEKTVLMLRLDRKYQSYLNYTAMDLQLEAFNALLQGMEAADQYLEKAEVLGIMQEYRTLAQQIEDMLSNQYGVSPEQAREWLAIEDPQIYSRTINDFLFGTNTLNLQTKDGQPYLPDMQTEENAVPEQPDNPVIAGEEGEFEENAADQPMQDAGAAEQPAAEQSSAEQPAATEAPEVVDSIQSAPPAEENAQPPEGGVSTQNVDELFENADVTIQ